MPWEVPAGPLHHAMPEPRFLQLWKVPRRHKFAARVVGPVPVRRLPRSVFVINYEMFHVDTVWSIWSISVVTII